MARKPSQQPGYQLLVTLADVEPRVWRRIVVPGHWHLGRLHEVLQVAMGWTHSHLHGFRIGEVSVGPTDPYGETDRAETVVRLHEALPDVGASMLYTYDFGDNWDHEVLVEALLDPQSEAGCLAGGGACPPEDCGGPWGYANMLAAAADPDHPDHGDVMDWLGGPFDSAAFDAAATDAVLRSLR